MRRCRENDHCNSKHDDADTPEDERTRKSWLRFLSRHFYVLQNEEANKNRNSSRHILTFFFDLLKFCVCFQESKSSRRRPAEEAKKSLLDAACSARRRACLVGTLVVENEGDEWIKVERRGGGAFSVEIEAESYWVSGGGGSDEGSENDFS